jgi:glutamine---fructose-6-phosphate transaminase (isomerizing)
MCGVIGYVGPKATPDFFFQALKRLEYRGYDSAGIAMLSGKGQVEIQRAEGKLSNLEEKLKLLPEKTTAGIGHTRWATHGKPTENNAHPHRSEQIVLLHNGIIENFRPLKEKLLKLGYKFLSETDTEVATHLLNYEYKNQPQNLSAHERMTNSLFSIVKQIKGAFAFAILCLDNPEVLYAVRYGSPMVLGKGNGESYLASGVTALVEHTKQIMFMEDNEIAFLSAEKIDIFNFDGKKVVRDFKKIEWSVSMMEKGGYKHFMMKEIHEQPQAVAQTLQGRIELENGKINIADYGISSFKLSEISRVQILACGTSYYSGLLAKYFIEEFSKIPVEVELASEYRYRTNTANSNTLAVAVSQSGETMDTLQSIKYAKTNAAKCLGIVNAPGSSIAQICDAESLIHAGPEIGVASTKAFSAQVTSLMILGLALAQENKKMNSKQISVVLEELVKIPAFIEKTLQLSENIEKLVNKYYNFSSILFIGRGPQWPVALEGALKLKELSYIHAEAYAAGELKHGPIALIDEKMVVVCIAPKDKYYEKTISNIEEIRARGGKILSIGTEGDADLKSISDDFIGVPECSEIVSPFVTTVPMHLFAYWLAVRKGTDVDQPRNLAKSVTVE